LPPNKPTALKNGNLQSDEGARHRGTDLIFIQEPNEYQNRPAGIEKKYRIFTAGNGKHRAAIIINNKIDAILIAKLSDEDIVLLEIIHENLKFFAASMYFDIEDQIENNFTKMYWLMRFVKGGRILIAMKIEDLARC